MAAVWFFCLGGLGNFFPFYSLYLHENAGLDGFQVGRVMAIVPLVGVIAQPLWGWASDRSGSRARVLTLLGVGSAGGYTLLMRADDFSSLLLGTATLAAFGTALVPSCVAVTLAVSSSQRFGRIRVWGTVGFLGSVLALPRLLDAVQEARGLVPGEGGISEPGLELMFPLTAGLVGLGALLALALPRGGAISLRSEQGDWRRLMRNGPFLRLLTFTACAYLFLQGPMVFFPIYVANHGGDTDTLSRMWVLMLLVEIPLVVLSGLAFTRLGARGLLAMGVLSGSLRWLVCGFAGGTIWVYPAQLLHGLVIAGLVIGAPLYVESVVPERLRSTGQGMLAMLGLSLGGASSNLFSGAVFDRFGIDAVYVAGGIGGLVLGCLVWVIIPAPVSRRSEE